MHNNIFINQKKNVSLKSRGEKRKQKEKKGRPKEEGRKTERMSLFGRFYGRGTLGEELCAVMLGCCLAQKYPRLAFLIQPIISGCDSDFALDSDDDGSSCEKTKEVDLTLIVAKEISSPVQYEQEWEKNARDLCEELSTNESVLGFFENKFSAVVLKVDTFQVESGWRRMCVPVVIFSAAKKETAVKKETERRKDTMIIFSKGGEVTDRKKETAAERQKKERKRAEGKKVVMCFASHRDMYIAATQEQDYRKLLTTEWNIDGLFRFDLKHALGGTWDVWEKLAQHPKAPLGFHVNGEEWFPEKPIWTSEELKRLIRLERIKVDDNPEPAYRYVLLKRIDEYEFCDFLRWWIAEHKDENEKAEAGRAETEAE